MDQISFADAEYAGKRKKTRREVFLGEMERVVPCKALLKGIGTAEGQVKSTQKMPARAGRGI